MHSAATIAAALLTDRIGRRTVLMTGASVCAVGQTVVLILAAAVTSPDVHVQLAFDAFYTIVAVRLGVGSTPPACCMLRWLHAAS